MLDPSDLRPKRVEATDLVVERLRPCTTAHYRLLYAEVGSKWHWHDREAWSDARLEAHLQRDAVAVHEMRAAGALAGYFELERHPGGGVEILYFGLAPSFIGKGLGAHLLTVAVEEAWRMGASSVFLNTCTLDHPSALANYRARGFTPFREEHYQQLVPDTPVSEERHAS
jgi:GNAT superfamily N-acetyltransferase